MTEREGHPFRAVVQRLRVPLGFLTAILFVIVSKPTWTSLAVGVPVALLGILVRAWASGHLRKNAELAVSGPYAFTRNPLYFGSFLMAVGMAIAGGTIWVGLWLVAFFLIIYYPVMQAEASHMRVLFADSYERWAATVPLFIPRVTPYRRQPEKKGFELGRYLHHREYRALIGLSIVIAILVIKIL
ncbi:MAG: isoprenylcysteine carboxylmethyltransferase family protein [Acidobacteriota bacterium]|nr:MAG: isoprenylcysteine carboxylmethyltransferase family protein [Acidobacteriota bacterium]